MKNYRVKSNRRFLTIPTLTLCFATMFAAAAHAELKGSYALQQGAKKLDLYYLDDHHMRANFADQQQLVLKGSASWLLQRQGEQWLAVDADQAAALLQAAQGTQQKQIPSVQLRDTGRQETVAGYSGRVFELRAGENTTDLVLTDHPDVLALTNGWRVLALKLSRNLGPAQSQRLQQALAQIPQRGMGGLLRQGKDLILTGLDKGVSASDVDFPANTQVLPKLSIPSF